jgi:hypothetical protein
LNRTPTAQQIRSRIDNWDCIKLKNLLHSKWKSLKCRDSPQNERKSLPAIHLTKD